MQKKVIAGIIAVLVVLAVILGIIVKGNGADKDGLNISAGGKEFTIAWDDIEASAFEGDLVNGKGETFHNTYDGAELSAILSKVEVEIADESVITATSEDNYTAELKGAELLESGKVYVALSQDGEMIEGIDGGQGAQLIVFGDANSKRAVRYLKAISVE